MKVYQFWDDKLEKMVWSWNCGRLQGGLYDDPVEAKKDATLRSFEAFTEAADRLRPIVARL